MSHEAPTAEAKITPIVEAVRLKGFKCIVLNSVFIIQDSLSIQCQADLTWLLGVCASRMADLVSKKCKRSFCVRPLNRRDK